MPREVGTVTVLTKAASSEANTAYAQGGIASVWSVDDSFRSHIEDTIRAGAGLAIATPSKLSCARDLRRFAS